MSLRPLAARVARLRPRPVAAWGFGAIFVFGALGTVETQTFRLTAFNLNEEGSVPSIFSTGLWIGAGILALCAAASSGRRGARAWGVLGALLVYLGIDEAFMVHETLEYAVGISYQRLYAPLMAAGAIAGAVALHEARRAPWVMALLVCGAGSAAAAQLVDLAQWDAGRLALPYWTTVPEELLEMTGLLLVGLSALVEVRRRASAPARTTEPAARPSAAPAAAVPPERAALR